MTKRIPITDRDKFILLCANEPENVYIEENTKDSITNFLNSSTTFEAVLNWGETGTYYYQPPIKTRQMARYYVFYETGFSEGPYLEKKEDGYFYTNGNQCNAKYFKRDGDYFEIDEDGKPV